MNDKKIEATVSYTGHDDYQGEFSPEVPVGTVKRKAMDKFEIEPSAAEKYALQFNGANLDEHTKIGDLGRHEVKLVLVLKQPQQKGYAG